MSDIKDGVYASVSGTVSRVFTYSGGKTGVEIHVKGERSKYPDRYTAFDVSDEVAEGDRVEIRGWLSTQVEEFQKRDGSTGHGVKRAINAPRVAKWESGGGFGGDDQPF